MERFPGFAKIGHVQNHGLYPRPFAQNRPIFDPYEFTRNRHKQSRKQSQIILERFWRRFREFGAISRTCQNRSCLKPWAIGQAFCSKSANFRPLRIHPKSTQTVAQAVTNHFRTVLEAFQRVWSDFQTCQNRPCSKPWAIAQAFCSKSANFRSLRIHPKSTQTVAQAVTNHFRTVLEAFQRVWSDFQTCQNRPCSKPWAIAQAFCSNSAKFRPLRIHPKSTQTVASSHKSF